MKKVAILQSNYIPWKGYFDLIAAVDEFILYDDMQFTKNDWRNRNRIKTSKGLEWLSIPVGVNINRKIREVTLPDNDWQAKHIKSLEINYRRAPYFNEVMELIKPIYANKKITTLTALNRALIEFVCVYLNIQTKISYSWDYILDEGQSQRLLSLCRQVNAQVYVTGPAAKDYINEDLFRQSKIKIEWFNYAGYQEYPQFWGDFEHGVTILDLLFNCGSYSGSYLKFSQKTQYEK